MSQDPPRNDPGYPQYQGDTDKRGETRLSQQLHENRRLTENLADKIYFIFAGLASIWLAVVALGEAVDQSWWSVLLILVFWGMAAYLTLPRMNRILTNIYVPDYFFGRTQTGDGVLGDPVNLAFNAEEDDIHEAMTRAGWTLAEPVTLKSSWRIIVSSLRKKSYPTAPVSPLFLFNKKQDFAYQQEVNGNPSKRHHVRFWKAPNDWRLPGGRKIDYLADATYDHAVGLSLFTMQVTHKVDPDTDLERDYVVQTVRHCSPEVKEDVLEDFMSGYNSRNGGGDHIRTDGNLPILDLDDVVPGNHAEEEDDHQQRHRKIHELAAKTPPDVWVAGGLVALVALLQLGRSLYRLFHTGMLDELSSADYTDAAANYVTDTGNDFWTNAIGLGTAILLVIALIQVLLAVNVMRGRNRPRQIILALLCISFVATALQSITHTTDTTSVYAVFVVMGSHVFAMLAYTSDPVVNYTYASAAKRKQEKEERAKR